LNSNENRGNTQHTTLENFKTYLITQKQVSAGVARNYCYSVGKFLRWVNTGNPTEGKAMQYYRYLQDKGYANSTIANIVYALNHYFKFLGKKIQLTPSEYVLSILSISATSSSLRKSLLLFFFIFAILLPFRH